MGGGVVQVLLGREQLADVVDLLQDLFLLVLELLGAAVADVDAFLVVSF